MLLKHPYGFSVDIWALGIIFLELEIEQPLKNSLLGKLAPWQRTDFPKETLLELVKDGKIRTLIASMLNRDVHARPTINEVVAVLSSKCNEGANLGD